MVRFPLFFLLLVSTLLLSACATTEDEVPETRPIVKAVIVEKNAAWTDDISSDEPPESCSDFVLMESDVREFFEVARKATHTEYNHDLLMSRCYASGLVTLQDGSEAFWRIDRARRGRLIFPDKRFMFFFCGKCASEAYGEPCDVDCINR